MDKVKAKASANNFQFDDKAAKKIYNIVASWSGNTGLSFKERDRIKIKVDKQTREAVTEMKNGKRRLRFQRGRLN